MGDEFMHEGLDCYKVAVQLSRWAASQVFPAHRKHLRDQLVRAADSIVLNIAEGAGRAPAMAGATTTASRLGPRRRSPRSSTSATSWMPTTDGRRRAGSGPC